MRSKVLHLYHKGEQIHTYFLVDGFEPDKMTVCQFRGCHWYEHTVTTKKIRQYNKRLDIKIYSTLTGLWQTMI